MNRISHTLALVSVIASAVFVLPQRVRAHCDTMEGPVVLAAKAALEKKDVTPVLKWVKKEAEPEIKAAFRKTVAVRTQGPEARDLADQFFFETLVRVHRAGEGAPFTGLKPAGTLVEPAVAEADKALDTGSVDRVVKLVTDEAAAGIRRRFSDAREKKAHADHNVDAGRDFVAAYVEYVHYVEGLHQAVEAAGAHHEDGHKASAENAASHAPAPEHNH